MLDENPFLEAEDEAPREEFGLAGGRRAGGR